MQRPAVAVAVGIGEVRRRCSGTVLPGHFQPVGGTQAFRFGQAGQAEHPFEEEDVILLVAHGGIGVVEVMLREVVHEVEAGGIRSRAFQQPVYVRRQGLRSGVREEREVIHEVLLHEGTVAAAERVAEIHPVPKVGGDVRRPLFGCGQRRRHIGQRKFAYSPPHGVRHGILSRAVACRLGLPVTRTSNHGGYPQSPRITPFVSSYLWSRTHLTGPPTDFT